jgi:hypothetical protein
MRRNFFTVIAKGLKIETNPFGALAEKAVSYAFNIPDS